jgi:hypothetical protein
VWDVKATKKKVPAKQKAASTKKAPARKVAAKTLARKTPAKKTPAKKPAPRADYGLPIDGFFKKQPPAMRPILEKLRALVEEIVPDADSSIKWGMPFYSLNGAMMCALGGHKSHVNLILAGAPGTFDDPDGLLEGDGKTGRRLKLTSLDQLPEKAVRGWLRSAAAIARKV